MEKKLHLQRRKGNSYHKHSSQHAYLPNVSFKDAKAVVNPLEKIHRDFLWEGGSFEKRPHLVNWKVVCTDKGQGMLGVRRLSFLNRALLRKWVWRFAKDFDGIWKRLMNIKYGKEAHGWRSKEAQGPY